MIAPADRRRLLLLAAVTLGAYALAPLNGWVWDDIPGIVQGRLMGSLRNLPQFFFHDAMWNSYGPRFALQAPVDTYRPVTMTTFLVERAIWGLRPGAFHLDSVLCHLVCVLLTFALGKRLGLSARAATGGAALFALHPSICEAVHWVNGRSDPLCLAFALSATILTVDAVRAESRQARRLLGVGLLALAAALCKETVYFLAPPAVFLAFALGARGRRLAMVALSWALGLGLAATLRVLALGRTAVGGAGQASYALLRVPLIWLDGLRSLVLPEAALRPSLHEHYRSVGAGHLALALVLIATLGVAALFRWRRGRIVPPWALASYLAVMAPIAMLTFKEGWSGWGRYLYEASPMVCIALAQLVLDDLPGGVSAGVRRILVPAFVLVCVACGVQTLLAARTWKDDFAFNRTQIEDDPASSVGWFGLGSSELRAGHHERAVPLLRRCTEISPQRGDCWASLASALDGAGAHEEAWRAALASLERDPRNSMARYVKALGLLKQSRQEESAALLLDVLTDEPDQVGVWRALADVARQLGPSAPFTQTARARVSLPRHQAIRGRVLSVLPL